MGNATIFNGNYIKALKSQLKLGDDVYIINGTADPTSVAQDAPRGSIYLRTQNASTAVYQKTDNGSSTNWTPFTTVGSVAPSDVNTSGSVGTSALAARADHQHRGVTSVAKNGSAALFGAVTLSQGTGITLTQTGNDIAVAASSGSIESVWVKDQQTAGVASGSFNSGSWTVRTLNVLTNPGGYAWASLASNKVTLSAGTYEVEGHGVAYKVNQHKARWWNNTDGTTAVVGSAAYTDSGNGVATNSIISGRFTIASSKEFEFQHRCSASSATQGYGVASNYDEVEIYVSVKITKVG